VVKKSAPAISPQWARRNVRQDDGRSGAGGIPLSFRTVATVLLATLWPKFLSAPLDPSVAPGGILRHDRVPRSVSEEGHAMLTLLMLLVSLVLVLPVAEAATLHFWGLTREVEACWTDGETFHYWVMGTAYKVPVKDVTRVDGSCPEPTAEMKAVARQPPVSSTPSTHPSTRPRPAIGLESPTAAGARASAHEDCLREATSAAAPNVAAALYETCMTARGWPGQRLPMPPTASPMPGSPPPVVVVPVPIGPTPEQIIADLQARRRWAQREMDFLMSEARRLPGQGRLEQAGPRDFLATHRERLPCWHGVTLSLNT
jgi:hypothetical protein